jgi:hypothetical protein
MTRHCRLPLLSACAMLASTALIVLPATASAAGPKVLLVTRGEEGEGPPAVQGEAAHVSNFVRWPALNASCGATDEQATVGKNPSGTVKVSGSDQPLSNSQCFNESPFEFVPGGVTVKSVSVSRAGVVKLAGDLEMVIGGCTYSAKKLTGTQVFGEDFAEAVSGTGKLKGHSAKTCAKTTPVEDFLGVADSSGFDYVVKLTS